MSLIAFLAGSLKVRYLQYPLQEVGEADPVDPAFREFVPETLIELECYVFVIVPVNGRLKLHIVGLFSEKLGLIGQSHFYGSFPLQQHTLTAKSGVETGVNCPVNEIFFFIGDLLNEFTPFIYIEVTSAAGAYGAAVMVELDVVVQSYLEEALVRRYP
jgi:hypothetical protein